LGFKSFIGSLSCMSALLIIANLIEASSHEHKRGYKQHPLEGTKNTSC